MALSTSSLLLAVVVALAVAAPLCVTAAGVPCCGPPTAGVQVAQTYVRENPPVGEIRGLITINSTVSFSDKMSATAITNGTMNFVSYQNGATKQAWVYIPSEDVCVNSTFDPTTFNTPKQCVGPGSPWPNFVKRTVLGGTLEVEAWGNAAKDEFVTVNPDQCLGVTYVSRVPGDVSLAIFYGFNFEFNPSVFNLPAACSKSVQMMELKPAHRQLHATAAATFATISSKAAAVRVF